MQNTHNNHNRGRPYPRGRSGPRHHVGFRRGPWYAGDVTHPTRPLIPLLLLALSLAAGPRPARAGEKEWVVSPGLGYRVLQARHHARHGGTVTLDVDYGLNDSWGLRGSAYWAGPLWQLDDPALLSSGGVGFGATYVFDVLRVVPFASATVGASVIGGGGVPLRWNAELRIGGGLDFLARRDFSVGLEVRYALQVPDFREFPWAISVALRLSWRRP